MIEQVTLEVRTRGRGTLDSHERSRARRLEERNQQ